jgi:ribosomal protein S27AE
MHPLATLVYFQLKYCERCGGLWLRPAGTATPYCPRCEHFMAALPLRTRRPKRKMVPATRVPAALALPSTVADVAQLISVGVS